MQKEGAIVIQGNYPTPYYKNPVDDNNKYKTTIKKLGGYWFIYKINNKLAHNKKTRFKNKEHNK